ncbi:pilus assembly protein TadG-related protein [Caulifigura coniformis]|nr:pilus assembly protein TadG-related protein [Caulifigura coniformis]
MHRPASIARRVRRAVARLHRDERGITSLLSLVAVMLFTMLLVMLTNIVRHVDDKVRMQNAADAAAFSGAAVLARGMNAIAFANHLEAETFALTALLRALEDRGSQTARQLLPVMNVVLGTPEPVLPVTGDRLIPAYQRDVVALFPDLARQVTQEIALRHGLPQGRLPQGTLQAQGVSPAGFGPRGPQSGVLWLSRGAAVGVADELDPAERTLPVIDPGSDGSDWARLPDIGDRQALAVVRRLETATEALRVLHDQLPASRRQDSSLLGDATRYLVRLLEVDFPTTNLPLLLRSQTGAAAAPESAPLEDDFAVIATVHRVFDREHGSKLFVNPIANRADAVTFAQAEFFLPRPRYRCCPWRLETPGGVVDNTDPWPRDWDSFNQTWSVRLVPADETAALTILQTQPPGSGLRPLSLEGVTPLDVERINTH